jgi:hypothetical protein
MEASGGMTMTAATAVMPVGHGQRVRAVGGPEGQQARVEATEADLDPVPEVLK